jgi:DNA-binding transcriptional regulator YbjK
MKKCHLKLKELIEAVILPDIEDELDDTFEQITKTKDSLQFNDHLKELHEMRDELQGILKDIKNQELSQDECVELFEEFRTMLEEEE